jgi:hypothetical protein
MAEGTEGTAAEGAAPAEGESKTEQTVPYERFQQANQKAKEAATARTALEKQVADLTAAMEERENAGLPELDRMRKDMERLSKRAEEAEAKAANADKQLARSAKERWVVAAAKDFADPSDAAAFVDFDAIEDEKDAERAVKKLAQAKKHLLKAEQPVLPGKVLSNGQPAPATAASAAAQQAIAEAQMLADGLRQFATKE